MDNQALYTIRKVGSNNELMVYAYDWSTFESVWLSQMCWYAPGTEVIITNEAGESKKFVK